VLRHVTAPDGVRIVCEVSGQGPPLVLVHGAGSARWGFAVLRPELEDRFTVIAIDRRGRGDSTDADAYALEHEFDDVAAVVRAAPALAGEGAGIRDGATYLFGHSYGGLVSAAAASRIAGLPRLVLYEPPMGGVLAEETTIARWEGLIAAGDPDSAVREFLHDVGGYTQVEIDEFAASPVWELRRQVVPTVPRELRAEGCHSLDRAALAGLEMPVLMLVGSESPEWATRSTTAYAEALPDVTVRTLEGQGHGGAVSAPGLVAAEVAGFLEDAYDD
jgi:pimeloyl-ACP methyl ester carboxylesterase